MSSNFMLTRKNIINGILIFSIGDSIATIILGQFEWTRLIGMCLVGGFLYAFEIPLFYNWIDRYTLSRNYGEIKKSVLRTILSSLFFNPLWISRHILFTYIFSSQWEKINLYLLNIGLQSFLFNLPVAVIANYFIQNRIPQKYRFASSAVFSALMAIYYAFSDILFR